VLDVHTSEHGVIIMLSVNVGMKSASASAFRLVSSGTLSWAPICVLPRLLEEAQVVVSARRSSSG
jgi:hypothetical protein